MDIKILIICFGAVITVLLAAVIILIISLKKQNAAGNVADELRLNREETARSARESRDELSRSLEKVESKLGTMTRENYDSRLELAEKINSSLYQIGKSNADQNERQTRFIVQSVLKLQESNEKKLEEMRVTVDEKLNATLASRLNTSFKTVSEQLENVYKSLGEMKELSAGVTSNVTALNKVLTNVKARGTWAEVQLEGILDQTVPGMYVKNFSPKSNSEKVEFAIRLPSSDGSSTYLPIDSKFPMEDYVRLCDACTSGDAVLAEQARKGLEDRVLAEAKQITKYINVPVTTPFAVLFLATEGLYAEIVSAKSGIAEHIQQMGIMIAGPTTVTALLNSFAMGFKAIAINEKADEVRMLLGTARAQYEKFGIVLEKAKRKIDEAGKSLEDAQKRNEIIRKKLKSVEMPDAVQADELTDAAGIQILDYDDTEERI